MESTLNFDLPAYHAWPQLYTIQKNVDTKDRQMQMWKNLILDFAKSQKKYSLTFNELFNSPICHNQSINRRLKLESI